jgi:hypothetical protein
LIAKVKDGSIRLAVLFTVSFWLRSELALIQIGFRCTLNRRHADSDVGFHRFYVRVFSGSGVTGGAG